MAKEHWRAAALFVVLAVVMTWPLGRTLNRAVAYPEDPYLNAWVLDWDFYATFHDPTKLFDAPAFFPARDALAFSENLYGIALLLFPLRAAGVTPIAAHNVAILAGFALSGFAAYLLGRLITGSELAGIAAGIFYAFVPFRFTHLSHVQHVFGAPLPLLLASLIWYGRKPTWPRALLFGAALLFNGLCNVHYLLFGTIAIAITFAILRPRILPAALSAAVALLLLDAFLQPYNAAATMYGMRRSWQETREFSALPSDWLVSNFHNRIYAPLRKADVNPERWLFPGVVSLLIGSVGFLSRDRTAIRIASSWLILGFAGSLGLHTIFHRFLFAHVPGFQAIRVPARWAVIAYVGLSLLVAIGTAMIARVRFWAAALIPLALVVELWSAPVRWYMAPTDVPDVTKWIAQHRPRAIVELPIEPTLEYGVMLNATHHHVPMVNGTSGFAPPEYRRIAALANTWSDGLVPELRRIGVTHIVIHADSIDSIGRAWISRGIATKSIAFRQRFDHAIFGDWLFALGGNSVLSSELDLMLEGRPPGNAHIAAALLSPAAGSSITASTVVRGFACSPRGIRAVNLLVNNGAIRLATRLRADSNENLFPGCRTIGFAAMFATRPSGVWVHTDVQPEIIDGAGERFLLEDRWVEWP
ncbi:MAG TPA: hypothetical protein VII32_03915 [Thermoanaerobaculia bacterium]